MTEHAVESKRLTQHEIESLVIKRLDYHTVYPASALLKATFKYDLKVGRELKLALSGRWFKTPHISGVKNPGGKYWVLVTPLKPNKVYGTVGLYTYRDEHEAIWLDWFALDPAVRGYHLGRKLLMHAIQQAKASGAKFLRLLTGTDPDEATAQHLYDSVGLLVYKVEASEGWPWKLLYRELQL